jgi:lipopolysaccharide/colanic/teichoic acid biosynthesis glycosyltransferase
MTLTTEQRVPVPTTRSGIPRSVEVGLSVLGLIVTFPLLAAAMTAVILSSPGGAIFRQARVGRRGRIFVMYKLRTMRKGAAGPGVTASGDPRITKIGRFLRRTKIDELPELWNVIRGDMSLVGPRPEVPEYVRRDQPIWQTILQARPGITDPVTLRLRDEDRVLAAGGGDIETYYRARLQPTKLEGYRDYLGRRTAWTDLLVLCQTALAVLVPSARPSRTLRARGLKPETSGKTNQK